MIEKIKKYWQIVTIIGVIIGWGISIGGYKNKIDTLEKQMEHSNELWEEQIAINAKLETIITLMIEE